MTLTLTVAVLGGMVIGMFVGHMLMRQTMFGALLGALFAVTIFFGIGRWTNKVLAVGTYDEFEQRVLMARRPVLVNFYSDSCYPCRRLKPIIKKLSEEYAGQLDVVKIDVIQSPDIAHEYEIQAIPNVILFVEGQAIHSWVGYRPASSYREVINSVVSPPGTILIP